MFVGKRKHLLQVELRLALRGDVAGPWRPGGERLARTVLRNTGDGQPVRHISALLDSAGKFRLATVCPHRTGQSDGPGRRDQLETVLRKDQSAVTVATSTLPHSTS